jgi:hypothetical protein
MFRGRASNCDWCCNGKRSEECSQQRNGRRVSTIHLPPYRPYTSPSRVPPDGEVVRDKLKAKKGKISLDYSVALTKTWINE